MMKKSGLGICVAGGLCGFAALEALIQLIEMLLQPVLDVIV
jgi:hypothetical protein